MPGNVPRKIRRFAIVSAITAFAPFIWVKRVQNFLGAICEVTLRFVRGPRKGQQPCCEVRTTTERLSFAVFKEDLR